MSNNTQSSPQSRDILRLKHLIIENNREISELLEECETRILTKQRKDKINYILKDLYYQLSEIEEALVLISN